MSQSSTIVSQMSQSGYQQHELNDIARDNDINPENVTSIVNHLLCTGQIEQIKGIYYKTNIIYVPTNKKINGKSVQAKIPWEDIEEMEALINKGLFANYSQIIREALKQYLREASP